MGKGHKSSQVVGYKYYLSMLMGLCRGPVDQIVQIRIGDIDAWPGSVFSAPSDTITLGQIISNALGLLPPPPPVDDEGPVATNCTFRVDAGNLFGGDDKEGGVEGEVIAMFGAPDQDIHGGPIPDAIGTPMSDLRGSTTLFFNDGLICSNNPYPKPWKVRVRRVFGGWFGGSAWYPKEASIALTDENGVSIQAMNPAHIIYECLTNPVWGRGLPTTALDEPSFISAANVLCREYFGLCLKWTRASGLDAFISVVINHIAGALYVDRTTGLIVLRLLRLDYDPTTLPVFDYDSGLLSIEEDVSTAPDNSHSELVVTWHDPVSDKDRSTRIQNLAGVRSSQTIASTTTDYPGIPTAALAARVAQRDMMLQGAGIKRFKLTLDRRGRKLAPAGVFRINVPSRSISNMVLRVGHLEEGPTTGETVTVTAVQDVFALETTTYLIAEPGSWVPPDRVAYPVIERQTQEMNYRDTVRALTAADLALVAVDSGAVCVAGKQPSALSTDFVLNTHAAGESYVARGVFSWTPNATLGTDVGYYDTAISLTNADRLASVEIGGVAWLEDECVLITDIDTGLSTITISRGCVDTVPVPHSAGARIWFPENTMGSDSREYTTGEIVDAKMLTRTNSRQLDLAGAPEDELTIVGRQGRPYPPGDLRTNGQRFGDGLPATGELVFTYTGRDRITQADHVLAHEAASTGPEAGTTYNFRFYTGATLLRTVTGVSAETFTYDTIMSSADGDVTPLGVQLEAQRDGLVSFQKYDWLVIRTESVGFNYNFNREFSYPTGFGSGFDDDFSLPPEGFDSEFNEDFGG